MMAWGGKPSLSKQGKTRREHGKRQRIHKPLNKNICQSRLAKIFQIKIEVEKSRGLAMMGRRFFLVGHESHCQQDAEGRERSSHVNRIAVTVLRKKSGYGRSNEEANTKCD